MDAEQTEEDRRQAVFVRKKNFLLVQLAQMEEESLQAENEGRFDLVRVYDLKKQTFEVILRTLTALETNPSYLMNKGLKPQIRPEVLGAFSAIDRQHLSSLLVA